jgi:hypothetical protein
MWWRGVVGLREGARTCGHAYRAVHVGTSSSMFKWALGRCKVHRGLYMGTSSMFLDLALCISFVSSFSIFVTFYVYFQEHVSSL